MASGQQDLDESQLAELREDLGEAFQGFLDGFLNDMRRLPGELEADLASGDLAGAAARAHRFKGTAGYLGAVKVADDLGQLQRAAENGDADEVRALVRGLPDDLAAFMARLSTFIGSG